MLEHNKQESSGSFDKLAERVAEFMLFGALPACPQCGTYLVKYLFQFLHSLSLEEKGEITTVEVLQVNGASAAIVWTKWTGKLVDLDLGYLLVVCSTYHPTDLTGKFQRNWQRATNI